MWCFTAVDPVHPQCHWSSEEKDYGEMVNSLLDENKKLEDTVFFFWDHSFPFPMCFFPYFSPPVWKIISTIKSLRRCISLHKCIYILYISIMNTYVYTYMFWTNLPSFNIHWWLFSFTPQRKGVSHPPLGGVAETHGMSSWQLGIQLSW